MTIDIMLPYWGDPQLLFRTIDSVRAQSDPHWRLTVIDDAYPDERVPRYFDRLDDPRVIYRRNDHNAGIVANFRASVEGAAGTHLVILGSDDLLRPDYVLRMREAIARHPDADVIQPGVDVIDADGELSLPLVDRVKQKLLRPRTDRGDVVLSEERLATSLVRGNWLYWPSLVFRAETIRAYDFRDDLPIILDLAILLDIAFGGGRLVVVPEHVFAYRRHSASASQTTLLDGRRFDDERRFYAETARRADIAGWRSTARAARLRLFSRLHAVTEAPRVLLKGTRGGRRALWRHMLR